ncbi:MAG: peptide chain release factor 3, partial [Saprospiraceae bacterium]|nr:peptide chain release factor 3 [Saprospiraceae bacterium]
IGMGQRFKGVYNLYEQKLNLFRPHGKQLEEETIEIRENDKAELENHLGSAASDELLHDLEIIHEVYPDFDRSAYMGAQLSPVFFGSAINNFGVKELLDCFIQIAPPPGDRKTKERSVTPLEEQFSGFVFKIHANMDPKHRDRIAFMRICSGKFERNKNYLHVRKGKSLKFSNPTAFMAARKSVIEEAFPGDIVGLYDPGNFKIGDSLTEGEALHFIGIPSFSPEQFRYIVNTDPMKSKQLQKGLMQLTEEGVAQLFTKEDNGRKIIGTVGVLQFDVIQYRLEHEYGASCKYEPLNLHKACWISSDNKEAIGDMVRRRKKDMALDREGRHVFLAESAWALKMAQENHPDVQFHFKSEF